MNLNDFKWRTIDLLQNVDPAFFSDDINNIKNIAAEDSSGFADIYAKCLIMNVALAAISRNNYFNRLRDTRKKLLLKTIMDDTSLSLEDKTNLQINQLENIPDLGNFEKVFSEYQATINEFLTHANELGPIYQKRAKKSILVRTNQENPLFSQITLQAKMHISPHMTVIDKNKVIGTTDLGNSLAVIAVGTNKQNRCLINIGQFPTIDRETILSFRKDLAKNYQVMCSTQIYLIGGCISTLNNNIKLLMQPDIGITDFRMCTGIGENVHDKASAVITNVKPYNILYNYKETTFQNNVAQTSHMEESTLVSQPFEKQSIQFYFWNKRKYDAILKYPENDEPFLNWVACQPG